MYAIFMKSEMTIQNLKLTTIIVQQLFLLTNIHAYLNLNTVMPFSGWAGWALTLFQPGGQIMPTALLLAHPDLTT